MHVPKGFERRSGYSYAHDHRDTEAVRLSKYMVTPLLHNPDDGPKESAHSAG